MKIAVISHAYQDDRYLATWDAIARLPDVEISLIHPDRYKDEPAVRHEIHRVADLPVPIVLGSRQGAFVYRPKALTTALDQARPDLIVHEQEVYAFSAAQVAAVAQHRSIPLVQFVWENVDRRLAWPRRLSRRYVLHRADALIAGSAQAKAMHEQWGFPGEIAVLPQMSVRPKLVRGFQMRQNDTLKVCFVGRLIPCKGVDVLLRAIDILHRRGLAIECTLAGDGPARKELVALARGLGLWALVHFRGHLDEFHVSQLLRASHVLVLPSRSTEVWEEQFGLVLAEAMAEGTITVGSRTGAIPEVIGTEQLLFSEDDAAGLAEILRRLALDADFSLWSRLHGWQRASQRFATEVVAQRKLQFLREVLERGPLPANQPIEQAIPLGTR